MRERTMKKLLGVAGFLALLLVFAVLPGTKADAATLKKGTSGNISANTSGSGEYHTLKVTKDSWVKLTVKSNYQEDTRLSWAYVTLYKGAKKISDRYGVSYYDSSAGAEWVYFALKKGTYRVHVQMYYNRLSDANNNILPNVYRVTTSIATKPDAGGNTKSKAVTLKSNKYKSGILALTEAAGTSSKGDWYKFKLTKTKTVKLTVSGKGSGLGVRVVTSKIPISYRSNVNKFVNGKSTKLPKGTYWIKMYKTSSTANGYYKLKVKY